MPPLVSIIIPCLNAAPWLAEALESCLSQTHSKIDVILVNNGSTDESIEVANRFQDSRLFITTCERRSASAARNVGLQRAQGEFIQYLDADDLLSPDKIKAQLELLNSCPANMISFCKAVHFFDGEDRHRGIVHDGWPMMDTDCTMDWLVELLGPKRGGMVPLGCWLSPRSIALQAGLWNEKLSANDDGEYFARVVLGAKGIRRSESGAYYYRKFRRGYNLSAQKSEAHWQSAILATDLIGEHLRKRRDDIRTRNALARHYMDIAFAAYPAAKSASKLALNKVALMGGTDYRPAFGTRLGQLASRVFGWRSIRLASHYFNSAKAKQHARKAT